MPSPPHEKVHCRYLERAALDRFLPDSLSGFGPIGHKSFDTFVG